MQIVCEVGADTTLNHAPFGRWTLRDRKILPPAKVQLPVAQLPAPIFWSVPWAHHVVIVQKVKDLATRRWYMEQTLANGWSRRS